MVRKKSKKLFKVLIWEFFLAVISVGVIIFKSATNNVFFPPTNTIIIIWIIAALYLGFGIWFEQIK